MKKFRKKKEAVGMRFYICLFPLKEEKKKIKNMRALDNNASPAVVNQFS